jgi:hypothetical protein
LPEKADINVASGSTSALGIFPDVVIRISLDSILRLATVGYRVYKTPLLESGSPGSGCGRFTFQKHPGSRGMVE